MGHIVFVLLLVKNINETSHQSANKGARYFIQVLNDIVPHIAKAARISPPVGAITFVKASPNWKARTAVCLVIPIISAKGAIIGIVIAAWPEPDGTTTLNLKDLL